jgi:hypothetical protein
MALALSSVGAGASTSRTQSGVGQGFVKTPDFIELIYNELAGTPTRTSQLDRTHH